MATKIVVPALGESIVEATVGRWFKKPGDAVEIGETLVEIETDKINLEVGAEASGVLQEVVKGEGQDVRVGEILGMIEPLEKTKGGRKEGDQKPAVSSVSSTAPPETVKSQESTPTGEMTEIAQTPPSGTESTRKPRSKPSELKSSGQAEDQVFPAKREMPEERITPLAKRLAEDYGLNPATIPGTGSGGRVTREDVERVLRPAEAAPEIETPPAAAHKPTVLDGGGDRREERVRMSRRRRTIAQRMVEAQHTAAILTTFNDVDMSAIQEIRKRRKEPFRERYGVNLGIVSFFVKAVIAALKDFPRVNAEIQDDEIILKHYYDIGIAVGAEEGLVVPVLRDADKLSFAEIETAIQAFVQKARDGSFSLEDLRGGTFTITNGGVFGSLLSTPILNYPEVAILGLHRIEERPVAVQGQVTVKPMMYLALSYDHRIVDGREAVQFLARVKSFVENPELLLIDA